MSLTFSLLIHLAVVLLIFLVPQAKRESAPPFITRLVTPDEMRREFPPEPPVKGSPKESPRSLQRPSSKPAVPRLARPQKVSPVAPFPSPQSAAKAAEKGVGPETGAGGRGGSAPSTQASQGTLPTVPEGGMPGGSGTAGSRRGTAIPAPGPTLREKLFDREITGKIARREDKQHDNSITFDTKEFKNQTYMMKLKERIEGIWKYPPEAAMRGIYGDLLIEFTIKKNGRLSDVELVRTSGHRDLDQAAMQALKDGEPYWPLPDEWGKDSLTITGHFVYSIYGTYIR